MPEKQPFRSLHVSKWSHILRNQSKKDRLTNSFALLVIVTRTTLLVNMSSRRSKGKLKSKEDNLASEEALILDPYVTIAKPSNICTAEGKLDVTQNLLQLLRTCYTFHVDHSRKKNCIKNPWCVYGLGEKEGIWRNNTSLLNCIGYDPSIHQRKKKEGFKSGNRLFPPAGLKNLGATCYLNVLVQVKL